MRTIHTGKENLQLPKIAVGCMRIAEMEQQKLNRFINGAMERGLNFFDHADIYGGGQSETAFANAIAMNDDVRETMILQSKCGIREGYYDFSKEHILSSVDGILQRLKTDYLDILLLHRPDALVEPDEVAEAFDTLASQGKVKYFGVSNQNPQQIALLKKSVKQPLLFNQLQLGVMNTGMIDAGLHVNTKFDRALDYDGGIIDYCRLHEITIQAWSPLGFGFFDGIFIDNDKFPELNALLAELAAEYKVSKSAIATAWILRHPANMQVVTGTTTLERLLDIEKARDVNLTREQWYAIYRSAGNTII